MKKSKALTFLTAGMILATTAGTYAVWDTMSASKGVTLDTAQASKVSFSSEELVFDGTLSSEKTSVVSEFHVTTENAASLTLAATDVKLDNTIVDDAVVKVDILDKNDQPVTTPIANPGANDLYKVKVTLAQADAAEDSATYAGKAISFHIDASIEK